MEKLITDKSKLCISNLMVEPAFLIKFIACSCVALRTSYSLTAKILSPTFRVMKRIEKKSNFQFGLQNE